MKQPSWHCKLWKQKNKKSTTIALPMLKNESRVANPCFATEHLKKYKGTHWSTILALQLNIEKRIKSCQSLLYSWTLKKCKLLWKHIEDPWRKALGSASKRRNTPSKQKDCTAQSTPFEISRAARAATSPANAKSTRMTIGEHTQQCLSCHISVSVSTTESRHFST